MKTALLLLAAGGSKRFGAIKQLTEIHGNPMVCHCLLQYRHGEKWLEGLTDGHVVLGANAELIYEKLPKIINIHIVNYWERGMGHTLAESMLLLASNTTHVLIGLADQVMLTPQMIKRLIRESSQHPHNIIAAKYAGRVGAPAIFPEQYFSQLCQLQGDIGARKVLQQHSQQIISIEMPEAAFDIDTQDDLNFIR